MAGQRDSILQERMLSGNVIMGKQSGTQDGIIKGTALLSGSSSYFS